MEKKTLKRPINLEDVQRARRYFFYDDNTGAPAVAIGSKWKINGLRPSDPLHGWFTVIDIFARPDGQVFVELNQPRDTGGQSNNIWPVVLFDGGTIEPFQDPDEQFAQLFPIHVEMHLFDDPRNFDREKPAINAALEWLQDSPFEISAWYALEGEALPPAELQPVNAEDVLCEWHGVDPDAFYAEKKRLFTIQVEGKSLQNQPR